MNTQKGEHSTNMNWRLITQWITIIFGLVGYALLTERRLSSVETAMEQELKGYQSILSTVNGRIDRLEDSMSGRFDKLDQRVDRLSERRAVDH